MRRRGLVLGLLALSLLSSGGLALSTFDYWIVGTSVPDLARFNGSWFDLDSSGAPQKSIVSGATNKDNFFLGAGSSEFTVFDGSFTRFGQSQTPFSNDVSALAANSTHAYIGTQAADNFLYDQDSETFQNLGTQPDSTAVETVTETHGSSLNDFFLLGTASPSVYRYSDSFQDVSPGFFSDRMTASARNDTHVLMADAGGNLGFYNGTGFQEATSSVGFSGNEKILAAAFGDFGKKPFWLLGGSGGRIEKLWVNGTSKVLSSDLPGTWGIESIGFREDEDTFFVGGDNGNLYAYQETGFHGNQPIFGLSGTVNFAGYSQGTVTSRPDPSILSPSNKVFSSRLVDLSVSTVNPLSSFRLSVDQGQNRTAGREGVFYVDGNGELVRLFSDGTVKKMEVFPSAMAGSAQLDDDPFLEVPFVDGNGDLRIIDETGENSTIDKGISTSKTPIAVGSWKEDKEYVFYPDASDNGYIKKNREGSAEETVGSGIAANGVLGPGNFDDDADPDLVFIGTSDTVKWLDGGQISSTGFSSFGSNNNKGCGCVSDLDGDGLDRVPYVTGSNNLGLLNYTGGKEILDPNYGSAAKTRPAALDWAGDSREEVLHINSNTGELFYSYLDGTVKPVRDANFSTRSASTPVGISAARERSINRTLNLSDGTHNIDVFGFDGEDFGSTSREVEIDLPPELSNLRNDVSGPVFNTENVTVSVDAEDQNSGVNRAILSTNETGRFRNKTIYGSPQTFDNVTDRTVTAEFDWRNLTFSGILGYRVWVRDRNGGYSRTPVQTLEVQKGDIDIGPISLSKTDPVEGEKFNVSFNVSVNAGEVTVPVNLTERTFDGTSWNSVDSEQLSVSVQSSGTEVSIQEKARIGPRNYTVTADPESNVSESSVSNNVERAVLNVSSNQVYYGQSKLGIALGSSKGLYKWAGGSKARLFYADYEALYDIRDLEPLNSSGDLNQADTVLNLQGHPDSLQQRYDPDGDGLPDRTKCMNLAGLKKCGVPVANSTNSSRFVTGLLYDGPGGFDGSQDIVFTTNVSASGRQGRFGLYSYEAKVPSTLADQFGGEDIIRVRLEVK